MTAKKRASKRVSKRVSRRLDERSRALVDARERLHAFFDKLEKLKRDERVLAYEQTPKIGAKTDADSTWVDSDGAPEWTQEQFERADLYHGDKLIRRGRPPSANPKKALKLRIDADVVEHFRATGPGWQTRINDTLRRAAKLKARA